MLFIQRPLSVVEARDPFVLQTMLSFYAREGASVVDVTANERRMWDGVNWSGPVTYVDIDPGVSPDIVADFRNLPFDDESIDVLVFDPPHLPAAAGSEAGLEQMKDDYGLRDSLHADNVSGYFEPFLCEANRVLAKNGLIFAKLKDYVHNHKYQWMLVEWVLAVRRIEGLTPCDLLIKRDPCGGNLKSGRWEKAYHARNAHCWWAVVRKGPCEVHDPRATMEA